MITLNVVEARMRRQKICEREVENYLHKDNIIDKIPYLRKFKEEQFLFGIYQSPTKWTVLSVGFLFAAYNDEPFALEITEHADKIHNYFANGNKFKSDALLDTGQRIWMQSPGMHCTFQNMLLMLQELPKGIRLKS